MAGRPPKPTVIHEIQGTKRKDRHVTARAGELNLSDSALPEPPEWLCEEAKDEWFRLLTDGKYAKALRSADWTALSIYCQMWARFVQSEKSGEPMNAKYISTMVSLGGKLGLNPADRVKVRLPEEEKPKTGWSQFRTSNAV